MASKREQAVDAVIQALTANNGQTVQELQANLDPRLWGGIDAAQSRGLITGHVAFNGQTVELRYRLKEANNG